MRCSIKKIIHAYYVMNDFEGYMSSVKKYVLLNELERYGVVILNNCELDFEYLKKVYHIVLERIIERYNVDGSLKGKRIID